MNHPMNRFKDCSHSALLLLLAALSIGFISSSFTSCIAVKSTTEENAAVQGEQQEDPQKPKIPTLSSKPSIQMSDDLIRSEAGDMVSNLPAQWFLMNTKTIAPQQIFAVASNPDYTLGLVYSLLNKEPAFDQTFQKEGIASIAKAALLRRERRNPYTKRLGEVEEVMVGAKRFGLYKFTTDNGATVNRVAVFRSALGNFYECTMTEFPFTGRKIPAREESDIVFASVLATIDY
jgi:hypothetical protein